MFKKYLRLNVLLFIIAIITVLLHFYWYEYRPYITIKTCTNEVASVLKGSGGNYYESYNFFYKMCLNKYGMR